MPDETHQDDITKPIQTLFGSVTEHPMPDFSNYDLWDDYMAQVWASLLKANAFDPTKTVLEVAPGATFKIAKALSLLKFNGLNFTGKLILVEPNPQLSEKILSQTTQILPQAEIQLLTCPFQSISLSEPISAILSNHPFDDFLSASLLRNEQDQQTLFQDITQESPTVLQLLKNVWQENANPSEAKERCQTLLQEWQAFLNRHPSRLVILSQYRSSYLDKNQLQVVNDEAQQLFQTLKTTASNRWPDKKIQALLNQQPHYQNQWIGTELLNAQNWLIFQQESF
jgi:serine/threonine protein kinase